MSRNQVDVRPVGQESSVVIHPEQQVVYYVPPVASPPPEIASPSPDLRNLRESDKTLAARAAMTQYRDRLKKFQKASKILFYWDLLQTVFCTALFFYTFWLRFKTVFSLGTLIFCFRLFVLGLFQLKEKDMTVMRRSIVQMSYKKIRTITRLRLVACLLEVAFFCFVFAFCETKQPFTVLFVFLLFEAVGYLYGLTRFLRTLKRLLHIVNTRMDVLLYAEDINFQRIP